MATNKKRILKWIFISIIAMGAIGGLIVYKMVTKPHRSVEDEKAITIAAAALVTAYEGNEADADKKYLGKVIEVTGEVNEIVQNQKGETVLTLKGSVMGNVICTILEGSEATEIAKGTIIAIKGFCNGYLLTDVKLDRCKLVKKQ